jgi:hypothetical protein
MTYEELRKKALTYADVHPESSMSLEAACELLYRRPVFFPFALALAMASYIEKHRASVEEKT